MKIIANDRFGQNKIKGRKRRMLWALCALLVVLLLGNPISLAEEAVPGIGMSESQAEASERAPEAKPAGSEAPKPAEPAETMKARSAAEAPKADSDSVGGETAPQAPKADSVSAGGETTSQAPKADSGSAGGETTSQTPKADSGSAGGESAPQAPKADSGNAGGEAVSQAPKTESDEAADSEAPSQTETVEVLGARMADEVQNGSPEAGTDGEGAQAPETPAADAPQTPEENDDEPEQDDSAEGETPAQSRGAETPSEESEEGDGERYYVPEGEAVIVSQELTEGGTTTVEEITDAEAQQNDELLKEGEEPTAEEKLDMLSSSYEAPKSAIQKAIDMALASIEENVTAVTIQVESGEYNGDIAISRDKAKPAQSGGTVSDKLTLNIVTADAKGQDGWQPKSDGSARVNGNILIDGINVLLAGLYLEMEKTISIKNADLTVIGTAQNDTVTIESENAGSVSVDTGDGGDAVSITGSGTTGEIDVKTGEGDDEAEVSVEKANGSISINTGAGDDSAALNLSKVQGSEAITVDTGDGDDTVSVGKAGAASTSSGAQASKAVKVNTGAGSDVVNVDVAVGDAVSEVEINDGPEQGGGYDYEVHLTGALNAGTDAGQRIYAEDGLKTIRLKNLGGSALAIKTIAIQGRTLTDDLVNKPRVEIDLSKSVQDARLTVSNVNGAKHAVYDATGRLFTDFAIVNTPTKDYASIIVKSDDGMLNKLIIDARDISEGSGEKEQVWLNDLVARNMALAVNAEKIHVQGRVVAADVKLAAASGTLGADTRQGGEGEQQEGLSLSGIIESAQSVTADFFNVNHEAEIIVDAKGAVYSGRSASLTARITQDGGILDITDITDMLNLVNVKVGSAKIKVDGKLYAGVGLDSVLDNQDNIVIGSNEPTITGKGDINLASEVVTTVDAGSSNKYLSSLAVSIAVVNSELEIGKTAVIKAQGDIKASAKGTVNATTHASAGRLPISLAVSAIVSDVHTVVDGARLEAGGNVTLEAEGDIAVSTSSDKGETNTSKSGGFFAVDVIVQDVAARVKNDAHIVAQGDVTVHSTANANAQTRAVSAMAPAADAQDTEGAEGGADANDGAGGSSPSAMDSVKNIACLLLGSIAEKAGLDSVSEKLTAGLRTAKYEVKLSVQNDAQKGQATLSRQSANQGTKVKVAVAPKEGYVVDRIFLRTLTPGAAAYVDGTENLATPENHTGENEWTFTMPARNVIVCVTYKEKTETQAAQDEDDDLGLNGLFGDGDGAEEEEDTDIDVSGLFNQAAGGADDTSLPKNLASASMTEFDTAVNVTCDTSIENGALLLGEVGQTMKVVPGKAVQVIVNPKADYQIKEGTLAVSYKTEGAAAGSEPTKEFVKADSKGRYFFTIPENVEGDVSFTCEFEAAPQTASAEAATGAGTNAGAAGVQVTGALAVDVVLNTNNAVIDVSSPDIAIQADGALNVLADAVTNVSTVADGTGSSQQAASQAAADDAAGEAAADVPETNESYAEYRGYAVKTMATQGGTIDAMVDSANRNKIAFVVKPDSNKTVKTVKAS